MLLFFPLIMKDISTILEGISIPEKDSENLFVVLNTCQSSFDAGCTLQTDAIGEGKGLHAVFARRLTTCRTRPCKLFGVTQVTEIPIHGEIILPCVVKGYRIFTRSLVSLIE